MAHDLESNPQPIAAERSSPSKIDVGYVEAHQATAPAENVVTITADIGTYKPYSGLIEAYMDLLKDPSEFDANYEDFYGLEAQIADWLRIKGDIHAAWSRTLCNLLGELNVER